MNIKKPLLFGALLWLLMFGFKHTIWPLVPGYTVYYTVFAVLTIIAAIMCFKREVGGIKNGALLGLIFIATGMILDAAITVPLFYRYEYIMQFFLLRFMWIGYIETLVITAISGSLRK